MEHDNRVWYLLRDITRGYLNFDASKLRQLAADEERTSNVTPTEDGQGGIEEVRQPRADGRVNRDPRRVELVD